MNLTVVFRNIDSFASPVCFHWLNSIIYPNCIVSSYALEACSHFAVKEIIYYSVELHLLLSWKWCKCVFRRFGLKFLEKELSVSLCVCVCVCVCVFRTPVKYYSMFTNIFVYQNIECCCYKFWSFKKQNKKKRKL